MNLTQLALSISSQPNFNIKLISTQTNGFMALGANDINLDISYFRWFSSYNTIRITI